jgi:hypothetical protein
MNPHDPFALVQRERHARRQGAHYHSALIRNGVVVAGTHANPNHPAHPPHHPAVLAMVEKLANHTQLQSVVENGDILLEMHVHHDTHEVHLQCLGGREFFIDPDGTLFFAPDPVPVVEEPPEEPAAP